MKSSEALKQVRSWDGSVKQVYCGRTPREEEDSFPFYEIPFFLDRGHPLPQRSLHRAVTILAEKIALLEHLRRASVENGASILFLRLAKAFLAVSFACSIHGSTT